MQFRTILLAFLLVSAVHTAEAGEVKVVQKDKLFSPEEITMKAGDTLTFVNEDDVTHNVFSSSADNPFEIKKQGPGETSSVTLSKAGEVQVKCAIHPKMKLTVKVE